MENKIVNVEVPTTKTISMEVPNYSQTIKRLLEVRQEVTANVLKENTIINAQTNNIIEQIKTYLKELTMPLFDSDGVIPFKMGCCYFSTSTSRSEVRYELSSTGIYTKGYFTITINSKGDIFVDNLTEYALVKVIKEWQSLKERISHEIELAIQEYYDDLNKLEVENAGLLAVLNSFKI